MSADPRWNQARLRSISVMVDACDFFRVIAWFHAFMLHIQSALSTPIRAAISLRWLPIKCPYVRRINAPLSE